MKINHNSIKNQRIKEKFIEREVYCCVTNMVEYILKKSYEDPDAPFSYEDLENLYPDHSDEIDKLEQKKEELEDKIDDEGEKDYPDYEKIEELRQQVSKIEEKIEQLEQEQEEINEPYEWWIVSDFLLNKLREHGEVVIEHENIWGRCTTGQAILLDSVISEICEEMEILEGQKYEWKV